MQEGLHGLVNIGRFVDINDIELSGRFDPLALFLESDCATQPIELLLQLSTKGRLQWGEDSKAIYQNRQHLRSTITLCSYRNCPREMTDSRSNFSGQFR
jgi:hypothetical protein